MATYDLIAIPLGLALVTVALRRVQGTKYWMVALFVIGAIGITWWFSRGEDTPVSAAHHAMAVIFLW